MNWGAAGAIAELVAALAAISTLVYLALQTRHSVLAIKQSGAVWTFKCAKFTPPRGFENGGASVAIGVTRHIACGSANPKELQTNIWKHYSMKPRQPQTIPGWTSLRHGCKSCGRRRPDLEFTVNASGRVEAARVVEEHPQGEGFGAAAIAAAEQYLYLPRHVNGVFLPTPGISNLVTFEIDGVRSP